MSIAADSAPTRVDVSTGAAVEHRLIPGRRDGALLVLPGAHMPASCRFGEDDVAGDRAVLVLSRPGYGRTSVSAGPSAAEFAARVRTLVERFGLTDVTVVGISMGARTAHALAAVAPDLVTRVVLLCPVSSLPWPESGRTRRTSRLMFSSRTQWATWGLAHGLLRRGGDRALAAAVAGLTTLPSAEAVQRLGADRTAAVRFLLDCRSGHGWDLDLRPAREVPGPVGQPVLVVASPYDGSVGPAHPAHLAATLPHARLVSVPTPTHLLWLGDGAEVTRAAITGFLDP